MRKKIEHSQELNFYMEFLDCTDEEYIKYIDKKYLIDVSDVDDTWLWGYLSINHEWKDICIVWCNSKDYDTISHEVSHAILDILDAKKIKYSEESKEIFSGFLWYWIEKGILFFKKK